VACAVAPLGAVTVRGWPWRGSQVARVTRAPSSSEEALLHREQAGVVVVALEGAALGVADAGDVAVDVVGLAQRGEPVLAVGPGLGARDQAAAGDLSEREALLGLAVVVGARRRDLHAVAVGHDDLGGEVCAGRPGRSARRRWSW
jgi:hypothetical protein